MLCLISLPCLGMANKQEYFFPWGHVKEISVLSTLGPHWPHEIGMIIFFHGSSPEGPEKFASHPRAPSLCEAGLRFWEGQYTLLRSLPCSDPRLSHDSWSLKSFATQGPSFSTHWTFGLEGNQQYSSYNSNLLCWICTLHTSHRNTTTEENIKPGFWMLSVRHNRREERTTCACRKLAMCSLLTRWLIDAEWAKMDARKPISSVAPLAAPFPSFSPPKLKRSGSLSFYSVPWNYWKAVYWC